MASKDITRLFVLHRRGLHAYLTGKVRDAETAHDLIQETFLRFAERDGGAAAIANERSYLYRTAHNLAVDHVRRQQYERTHPVADDDLRGIADNSPSQERTVEGQAELARLRAVLQELPERTREVFTLVRIEGLTGRGGGTPRYLR